MELSQGSGMSKPQRLVVLSAGGTAKDVVSMVDDINRLHPETYQLVGYLDDNPALNNATVLGRPVLGGLGFAKDLDQDIHFVNALGSPKSFLRRAQLTEQLGVDMTRFATIIHPTAVVSAGVSIGQGCIVYPNVVLMTDVQLEEHVTILAHCTINHDSVIGAYSILASGVQVAGGVKVGRSCYLGTSSSFIQGIQVGDKTLIGMGAVVIRDVQPEHTLAGNPARAIKQV